MFAKTQLVFDVSAPTEGDKVGAYVLSSSGQAISSTGTSLDVNVTSAINVSVDHANDSIKIGDGTDFLAINNDGSLNAVVTATDLDIRDLSNATDSVTAHQGGSWTVTATATDFDIRDLTHASDSIKVGDGTDFLAINNDGSINATVTATNLDIRDLAFASDSVTAHQGGSWTVTANDAALANTAIENTQKNTTTTSAALLASQLANRKYLYVQNNSGAAIYLGKSGVTTADGIVLSPSAIAEFRLGPAVSMHSVTASGTRDTRIMELS
jgi:hypothetical protein